MEIENKKSIILGEYVLSKKPAALENMGPFLSGKDKRRKRRMMEREKRRSNGRRKQERQRLFFMQVFLVWTWIHVLYT